MSKEKFIEEFKKIDYYVTPNVAHGAPVMLRDEAIKLFSEALTQYEEELENTINGLEDLIIELNQQQ